MLTDQQRAIVAGKVGNASRIQVLLVEDDADDFILTRALLSEANPTSYELHWAATYEAAVAAVESRDFDICLVDYRLGAQTGLDLIRHLTQAGCTAQMIILTGQGEADVDFQAMEAGATDFLHKAELTANLLERSIRYAVGRAKTVRTLRELVQEKTSLLSEVNHRVKNNLQVVSSLLELALQDTTRKSAEEVLRDSQRRVSCMALVHEYLCHSTESSNINFAGYAESLIHHFIDGHAFSRKGLTVESKFANVLLPIDQAVACGMILNELVSNAFKHAYTGRDKGVVRITVQLVDDAVVQMTVEDDGNGLPSSFNLKKTLGMKLVSTLVRQIGGTLSVRSESGTSFHLEFPRPASDQAIERVGPHDRN